MSFKSVAEFLALKGDDAPTTAERKLITSTQAGKGCWLCDAKNPSLPTESTDETRIRAPLLRLLITGSTPACGLHELGVTLFGGWIEGTLDLAFCRAPGKTVLNHCHFAEEPRFEEARFRLLSLSGSTLSKGLYAQGARVKGSLFLRNVNATGTVDLAGAKIGAQLDCDGARFVGNKDAKEAQQVSLNAQGLETGQALHLRHVTAIGTVNASGAKIGRQFSCVGARFDGGKDEQGNPNRALNAQRVETGHSLFLSRFTATGTVALTGAKIGGQLACDDASFDGGKDAGGLPQIALWAQGLETGQGLFLSNVTATSTVDLAGAKISGPLDCEGARLDGGKDSEGTQQRAFQAQRVRVAGSFLFRKVFEVKGAVDLTAAQVGDLVDDVKSWTLGQDLLILDGFTYDRLAGTAPTTFAVRRDWLRAGSHLWGEFLPQPYTQLARVLRQMGHAGEARKVLMERTSLQAEATRASRKVVPNGDVSVGFHSLWADILNAGHWIIDRIAFRVAGYGHAPVRSLWCLLGLFLAATTLAHLAWDEGSFAPNSDVILASAGWAEVTALDCHPTKTEDCDKNPALTWSNTFTASAETPTQGADWDSFNRYGYAADLVVPFLDLGQTDAWAPSKDRGNWGWWLWWSRWVLATLGWIVTGLGVAAVTGVMQRNQPD